MVVVASPLCAATDGEPSPSKLNRSSVSNFASSTIPVEMRDAKIPGAVFVVVRDDRVLCKQAFGVADLKSREAVTTGHTLFRVASISKILTATAALQLADAGKLDLHRDVNDYLTRFEIADSFDRPVTLYNLLTHSAGFDQCTFGYAARSSARKLPLRAYLMRYQPERVRPPGRFSVYDNYGFALAGYLVQRASGVPFADCIRKRILAPLGMEYSSFAPDAAMRRALATGYWLDGETPRAYAKDYVNISPAAGLCTTADDMGAFMIALLANRRDDGSSTFRDDVISGLETQQFASHPEVPGRCFGFNRIVLNGRPVLQQLGQWPGFTCALVLFPRQHCGLFLAYNLCDDWQMERKVARQFAKQFIALKAPTGMQNANVNAPAAGFLEPFVGHYLSERAAHETPRLRFPREVEVFRSKKGGLIIGGEPYARAEPGVFERIGTNRVSGKPLGRWVAFQMGSDGKVSHLITQSGAYRATSWFHSRTGYRQTMTANVIVLLSAVVLWPLILLSHVVASSRSQHLLNPKSERLTWVFRGTALAACVLALGFEAAFALTQLRLEPFAELYGFPTDLRRLLWMLPVLLVLTVLLGCFSIVVWWRRLWHPVHRLHFTLLTCALILFLYGFHTRNLLFAG